VPSPVDLLSQEEGARPPRLSGRPDPTADTATGSLAPISRRASSGRRRSRR